MPAAAPAAPPNICAKMSSTATRLDEPDEPRDIEEFRPKSKLDWSWLSNELELESDREEEGNGGEGPAGSDPQGERDPAE